MTLQEATRLIDEDVTFILRPATWDDMDAIVDFCNSCAVAEVGQPDMNTSRLRESWEAPEFDLVENTRVVVSAEADIVGYIELWNTDPLPVRNWIWARTHPDFQNQGIGTLMMDWADEKLQETVARVPDDLKVSYHSGAVSTCEPANQFLLDRGMPLVRKFWRMQIDLDEVPPEPTWPIGIRLVSLAETNDLAAVYLAFNDSFSDHWGHVDQPKEQGIKEFQHWLEASDETDASIWFMAMDGDEIAAVCLCSYVDGEDPEMGWVNVLGVRRPWRKQGLGLALLHHAFGRFREMGRLRAGLGVDAGSLTGATRLYERARMHPVRETNSYEKVLRPGRDLSLQTLEE